MRNLLTRTLKVEKYAASDCWDGKEMDRNALHPFIFATPYFNRHSHESENLPPRVGD